VQLHCPNCSAPNPAARDFAVRSPLRWLLGRRAQHRCVACDCSFAGHRGLRLLRYGAAAVMLVAATVLSLRVGETLTPVADAKMAAANAYSSVYGKGYRGKIHDHWGWMYSSKNDAKRDYNTTKSAGR
jgi:transposase